MRGIADSINDSYDILGIVKDASYETIKSAYRRALLAVHPDKPQSRRALKRGISVSQICAAYKDLTSRRRGAAITRVSVKKFIEGGKIDIWYMEFEKNGKQRQRQHNVDLPPADTTEVFCAMRTVRQNKYDIHVYKI